ncbi:MAG TPA: nucleotidyltransferase family protein [Thermoanaerobaculia bacterium]|nr:nucleotidyltransferase family protein [Thermoanaerobaculia bacterium]
MPTCLVLAAGASKRLGRPKQLVLFEGEPLVVRAARIASEVAPAIVVVSPELRTECEERLQRAGLLKPARTLRIVENPDASEGMASSIRAGVEATRGDVLMMLCDQPYVTSEHLRALVDAHAPIAATGYNGIRGVPALFAAKFREELLALRGDAGARRIIEAHRGEVVTIPFEAAGFDVDTDAALSL